MNIHIKRLNEAVHFRAENEEGQSIEFDGSPDYGGQDKGMRPMQILLSSVGACSVLDMVAILDKMREPYEDIQVKLNGTRKEGERPPKPFTAIHITFVVNGKVNQDKAEKAAALSVQKYCSVAESLDPNIKITHAVEIEG